MKERNIPTMANIGKEVVNTAEGFAKSFLVVGIVLGLGFLALSTIKNHAPAAVANIADQIGARVSGSAYGF